MQKFIESCLKLSNRKNRENFNQDEWKDHMLIIISFVIVLLLLLLVGKYLWNNVAYKLLNGVLKPADSVWEILGLSILLRMMLKKIIYLRR